MLSICLTRALVLMIALAAPATTRTPAAAKSNQNKASASPPVALVNYTTAGPHEVTSVRVDWTDSRRERDVPAKIYFPADGDGPFPIVIFSHGLGGSREGYAYLGRHWASHGYVAVHLQHEGSDADVWRGQNNAAEAMNRAAKDPSNSINRPKDVSFAIDELTRMNAEEDNPLHELLALDRIAVAGHSFGAFTALAAVGEAGTHARDERALTDRRIKAAIPMSSPVPAARQARYDAVYGKIATPCLHMTGTLDEIPTSFTRADDRRIPYDHIKLADQYLVTFVGGDHMIFSGRVRRGRYAEKDTLFQDLIRMSTTAFLEAYLKDEADAKTWLQTGGLKTALGTNARLELKRATSQPAGAEADAEADVQGKPAPVKDPARPRPRTRTQRGRTAS